MGTSPPRGPPTTPRSPMPSQLEGSRAVAETVALCRPEVIGAYPISPQTHIVQGLSALVKSGRLAPCEYVNVESEFAAMSVCIGAAATGARTYTASARQGPGRRRGPVRTLGRLPPGALRPRGRDPPGGPGRGGMMRFGIPRSRLPREILDAEIERILAL